jgi:O-Antigen ligase
MSPKIKIFLMGAAGCVLGVMVGIDLADESYGWAVACGLVCSWLLVKRLSDARPEAWLIAAAVVGYIVGNRGFAQIQPSQSLPLLPAEGVLLVAVPAFIVRVIFKKSRGFRKDALNISLLVWIVVGSVRLPFDMETFGILAVRDFATIYYAMFFFLAQDMDYDPSSRRLLHRSLTIAFLVLLPVVVVNLISPEFLIDNLTLRGIPIIYHKSDLIATSLAGGFFWLWTRWDKTRHRPWLVAAFVSLLLIASMASPRAGMLAVALASALWLLTGRWRIIAAMSGVVAASALAVVIFVAISGKDFKTSIPYSMYEHAISIFDPAGNGTYINGESGELGGNNRFRWVWWRDVVEDTLSSNPVFGLGFGSDISTRFLADYDLLNDENFAARSPHSVIVTVIGRMGLLGLAGWVAVSVSVAMTVWKLLKRGEPDGMGLASIVTVTWMSACFGVVLEGPMGAVVFWTALGLAHGRLSRLETHKGKRQGETAIDDWPVAKPVAIDTH